MPLRKSCAGLNGTNSPVSWPTRTQRAARRLEHGRADCVDRDVHAPRQHADQGGDFLPPPARYDAVRPHLLQCRRAVRGGVLAASTVAPAARDLHGVQSHPAASAGHEYGVGRGHLADRDDGVKAVPIPQAATLAWRRSTPSGTGTSQSASNAAYSA